jgi:energy-converting hydrogenase Eha subunit E
MLIAADFLGLGHSTSSFGETLALALTFIGVGVIVNVLIVYAVVQVMVERRQNRERMEAYERSQPHEGH